MRHYCFIKAINIGGKSSVNMSDLVEKLKDILACDVLSYLNSGNLIINGKVGVIKIENAIKEVLKDNYMINTEVFAQKEDELIRIIENYPFAANESDKSKQIIYFMKKPINRYGIDKMKENKAIIEPYYLIDDILYVYYINGLGRSKLTTNYVDRVFQTKSTGRNTNTIEKIRKK